MIISIVGSFPPFRGGIADLNTALANNLSKKHTVWGINFTTQYPPFLFPGKTQFKKGMTAVNFSNKRVLSSINPLSWRRTAKIIHKQNPDLVIFRYWMPFFAPALRGVAKNIKKYSSTRTLAICDNIIPHEKRFFDQRLTRSFIKYIDRFIVMSKTVENDLLTLNPNAIYRYSPHPIYNIFGERIEKQEAKNQLKLTSDKVILYFGLIRQYKGLDILIKAAKELKSRLSNFSILVVGECYEDPNKYNNLVVENDVEDVVDLRMEFVPDKKIPTYFSAADVVVLPYRTATQSGIVQIAYHFNTPVIVSNVGGLPEIVPNGKVGYVVDPQPQAFTRAIVKFYYENRLTEFSKNVAEYKERFSWNYMIRNIEELMEE